MYKNPAVYLSGAIFLCFGMIRDLGSPTIYRSSKTIPIALIYPVRQHYKGASFLFLLQIAPPHALRKF